MVVNLRKWLERLKYIVAFLLLSYLMVQVYQYVTTWMAPKNPYRIPKGQAVKVTGDAESGLPIDTVGERLKLFYWLGE